MGFIRKISLVFTLAFCGLFGVNSDAQSGTFTFECVCANIVAPDCDICNSSIQSRYFSGLYVKKNGVGFKWIDAPYIVKWQGNNAVISEIIPNPETITIGLLGTVFSTLDSFKMALDCRCSGGGIDSISVAVDTPIIGNGSPENPITIGQFGADTTMYLKWNGSYWYPAKIDFTDILVDLPYYTCDSTALAGGLSPGDPYLLDCNNCYDLPAGLFKVVKICGYECNDQLLYFSNDTESLAGGIPYGREYVIDEDNLWGVIYGTIKVVTTDTIDGGTLECNTDLPEFDNHIDAITGGLLFGDLYTATSTNTYGAPEGTNFAVSSISSTVADAPVCCENERLPFYDSTTDAIAGGLSSGYYYYLSSTNSVGWPYGTKIRIP